jgi:hypothetical protein
MTRATGGTRTSAENNSKDLVVLKCLLYLFSCDLDRQRRDEQDGLGWVWGRMVEGGPMSVKSFMGEVNAVVLLAPALHLSLTGHWTSIQSRGSRDSRAGAG